MSSKNSPYAPARGIWVEPAKVLRSARDALLQRFTEGQIFAFGTLILVSGLVLVPILLVIVSSFQARPLLAFGSPTAQHYIEIFFDPGTYRLLQNTLVFAFGAIVTGFSVAIPLAWLVERTNTPGRDLMYSLILIPMAIPPMISALGWERLLDPRIGLINLVLRGILGIDGEGPFNIFTIYGMAFVMGLSMVPTIFLMMVPILRNMDRALEEASTVSGAGRLSTVRYVTLPLAAPALFAALIWFFILAIGAFEIPGVIGMQAGIFVFSTRLYWAIHPPGGEIPNLGLAGAIAVFILILSGILVYLYLRALGTGEKFATVTGRGYRPAILDLGRWKYAGTLFFLLYMFVDVFLPVLVLGWGSLLHYYQPPSLSVVGQLSLANYSSIFGSRRMIEALQNTGILIITAATAATLVAAAASWVIVRFRGRMRILVDVLSFSPLAIPGVIIGVALVVTYLTLPLGLYGTIWIIVIAHTTNYLAYGSRAMTAAQVQIHKELEEASYIAGASVWATLRRIVMPIILPALVGVWLWVALHSLRELSAAVVLATPRNLVASTMIWFAWHEGAVGEAYALAMLLIAASVIMAVAARAFLRRTEYGRA